MQKIIDRLENAVLLNEFCINHKIPKNLVEDIEVTDNNDIIAHTGKDGKPYILGNVREDTCNTLELAAYLCACHEIPYAYHPGEQPPLYIDGNELRFCKPEIDYAKMTYDIHMKNGYNLRISPYFHEREGVEKYAFSLDTDPNIRVLTGRMISPHSNFEQIDEIYSKVSKMQTIPVIKAQIMYDPWDIETNRQLMLCMEEMIHPVKSDPAVFHERWDDTIAFVDIDLYKGLQAMSQVYDSPNIIQKIAEKAVELTTENRSILDAAEQHRLWGEELDRNDKIEDDNRDQYDAHQQDVSDELDDLDNIGDD